jgi:hypothetical protein
MSFTLRDFSGGHGRRSRFLIDHVGDDPIRVLRRGTLQVPRVAQRWLGCVGDEMKKVFLTS